MAPGSHFISVTGHAGSFMDAFQALVRANDPSLTSLTDVIAHFHLLTSSHNEFSFHLLDIPQPVHDRRVVPTLLHPKGHISSPKGIRGTGLVLGCPHDFLWHFLTLLSPVTLGNRDVCLSSGVYLFIKHTITSWICLQTPPSCCQKELPSPQNPSFPCCLFFSFICLFTSIYLGSTFKTFH